MKSKIHRSVLAAQGAAESDAKFGPVEFQRDDFGQDRWEVVAGRSFAAADRDEVIGSMLNDLVPSAAAVRARHGFGGMIGVAAQESRFDGVEVFAEPGAPEGGNGAETGYLFKC